MKKNMYGFTHNVALVVLGVVVATVVAGAGINVYKQRNSSSAKAVNASLGKIDTGYSRLSGVVCKVSGNTSSIYAKVTITASMPMTSGYYTMNFWGLNSGTGNYTVKLGSSTSWGSGSKLMTKYITIESRATLQADLRAPSRNFTFPNLVKASTIPGC